MAQTESLDLEQLQHEIEETRERLGDTVEALAHKTDVKAQTKEKLQETKDSVAEKKEQRLRKAKSASPDGVVSVASQASQKARQNPVPLVALAGAFTAGFLAGRVSRH